MSSSARRIVKFSFIAILFLSLIVAWLGFGERGFIHLYRMERKRQACQGKIEKLESENHELLEEIHRLRTDREYIESVARRELGLVKDNEVFYRFSREGRSDGLLDAQKKGQ